MKNRRLLGTESIVIWMYISVPARHISEGAAPCSYWLAPCPIYMRPARKYYLKKKNIIYFLFLQNVIESSFCVFRHLM